MPWLCALASLCNEQRLLLGEQTRNAYQRRLLRVGIYFPEGQSLRLSAAAEDEKLLIIAVGLHKTYALATEPNERDTKDMDRAPRVISPPGSPRELSLSLVLSNAYAFSARGSVNTARENA